MYPDLTAFTVKLIKSAAVALKEEKMVDNTLNSYGPVLSMFYAHNLKLVFVYLFKKKNPEESVGSFIPSTLKYIYLYLSILLAFKHDFFLEMFNRMNSKKVYANVSQHLNWLNSNIWFFSEVVIIIIIKKRKTFKIGLLMIFFFAYPLLWLA